MKIGELSMNYTEFSTMEMARRYFFNSSNPGHNFKPTTDGFTFWYEPMKGMD